MAAKKKGSGGRGKTGQTSRTQVVEEFCHACAKVVEVVHVQTLGLKCRWSWNCKDCGGDVDRRR